MEGVNASGLKRNGNFLRRIQIEGVVDWTVKSDLPRFKTLRARPVAT